MGKWAFLCAAIIAEVTGTLAMRASQDHPAWLVLVAVGYVTAFAMLTKVLRAGMPVGVAYGMWTACGVALVAVAGRFLFSERLTPLMMAGIVLIMCGVLTIDLSGSLR